MSRSSDYLRSLTSLTLTSINFYKLGQIAGYIDNLEKALANVKLDVQVHVEGTERYTIVARIDSALKEPEI